MQSWLKKGAGTSSLHCLETCWCEQSKIKAFDLGFCSRGRLAIWKGNNNQCLRTWKWGNLDYIDRLFVLTWMTDWKDTGEVIRVRLFSKGIFTDCFICVCEGRILLYVICNNGCAKSTSMHSWNPYQSEPYVLSETEITQNGETSRQ